MNGKKLFFGIYVAIFLTVSTAVCYGYQYIDVNPAANKKIPLAVAGIEAMAGDSDASGDAGNIRQLISDTLAFTGYFDVLSFGQVGNEPGGLDEASVNFKKYSGAGAELLVSGGVKMSGGQIQMDLALFDSIKATRLIAKRYTGNPDMSRKMVRRFCAEIMKFLTNKDGFFDSSIAFVSKTGGKKEIFTCDFDGYNVRQATKENSISLSPAWSSDGQWLAYTSYRTGQPSIHIKGIGQKKSIVAKPSRLNISPVWLPGQHMLAATLASGDDQDIYLLTGEGKIIKKLTDNLGIDVSPTFSPDGRKMAFVSSRAGNPQIYVKDLDSGNTVRITYEGKYNTNPSWSPDGTKITYSSLRGGAHNVCVINPDGSGFTALTNSEGNNETPSWSPDGSLIAFSSTREGGSRIYVMTAYGTDQRRLLTMGGEQSEPRWSPNMNNE